MTLIRRPPARHLALLQPGQMMTNQIRFNPHIRFFDGDCRGYVRCRVGRSELRADVQVVSTVGRPDAPESTLASFVVENGQPGARRSS